MLHAVIQTGGKQYRVAEGDLLFVEKLSTEGDALVKFEQVLALTEDEGA
ncbi:MAG: 50S ribosomal protein L21, partial [Clostridiales bacterium]|nr:50S ribosomal protein L21 [Clostridiales bacterium]